MALTCTTSLRDGTECGVNAVMRCASCEQPTCGSHTGRQVEDVYGSGSICRACAIARRDSYQKSREEAQELTGRENEAQGEIRRIAKQLASQGSPGARRRKYKTEERRVSFIDLFGYTWREHDSEPYWCLGAYPWIERHGDSSVTKGVGTIEIAVTASGRICPEKDVGEAAPPVTGPQWSSPHRTYGSVQGGAGHMLTMLERMREIAARSGR